MENKKRKSFFDELGFKQTIEKLIDHIAKLYLEDNIPWIVGYSGGKDSSACVQLMWKVLEKLKAEKKEIKPLYKHCITLFSFRPTIGGIEIKDDIGGFSKSNKSKETLPKDSVLLNIPSLSTSKSILSATPSESKSVGQNDTVTSLDSNCSMGSVPHCF